MSQFDTAGSGDLPVGPVRIHFDNPCDHDGTNVCRECVPFTPEEVEALRAWAARIRRSGQVPTEEPQ